MMKTTEAPALTCTAKKKARSPFQPTGCWIVPARRLAIYLRDSMTCLMDLHGADPRDITLDHLVSKADGGSNKSENLITACRSCNSARQNMPLNRFASVQCRAHIRRNTKRSMPKYLKLAKALISGKTGDAAEGI